MITIVLGVIAARPRFPTLSDDGGDFEESETLKTL